ncbi:MAG: hypothetical protein MUF15_09300 [Acidobacteria bacterium]|nr:hypothetical protein [Acidobacteriota bacterium]
MTKETIPSTHIHYGLSPIEQAEKYRKLSGNKFMELFGDRVVGEINGAKYDLLIIRRYEYDAILEYDFTICPIPKNKTMENPRDPKVFFLDSFEDSKLMLGLDFIIQRYFRKSGCDYTVSVSNTAPYDPTVSIKLGKVVKEKTTQSTLFHHTKVFGYPASALEPREISATEREYVFRPLLNEFEGIVQHLAKINRIAIYEDNDLSPAVDYRNEKKILNLYLQFFEVMMSISRVYLGPVSCVLDTDDVVPLSILEEYRQKGLINDSLRVAGELALKYIDSFLGNERNTIPLTDTELLMDVNLAILIKKYLRTLRDYIKDKLEKDGENVRLIYGPCFSNILRLDSNGNPKYHFVDASIIRKGGNTVLGIFPKTQIRALTAEEKTRILRSNNNLSSFLQNEFGAQFVPSHFQHEIYFSKFDQVYI